MANEEKPGLESNEKPLAKASGSWDSTIRNWFKDRYNLLFAILFAAVLIYRIYWFFKVGNQPLWYDEADYMNIARDWIGGAPWTLNPLRPIILPVIASVFFYLGIGETSLRLLMLVVSMLSLPLMYFVGKTLFDKRAGLIGAFILAVFWSWTFYTYRLLVDIPVATLWLAAIYFFFDAYLNDRSWKRFALAGVFLGLAFLAKFSSVILVLAFAIYLLTTERFKIFKNKNIWAFFITSLITISPYLLWQYVRFGSPIAFYTSAASGFGRGRTFIQSLTDQVKFSIELVKPVLVILIILGALYLLYELLLLWNNSAKKNTKANKLYFVMLWAVLSMLFFGWLNYGAYMDERYYFVFYPALFLLAGNFLVGVYELGKKYSRYISIAIIAVVLIFAAYQNLAQTGPTITNKIDSFIQPKEAGLWIKENTLPDEKIISIQTHAELQYYAEREVLSLGEHFNSSKELENYVGSGKASYVVLSVFYPQNLQQWHWDYFSNAKNLQAVQAYPPYIDKEQQLPILTIFKVVEEPAPTLKIKSNLNSSR